MNKIFFLDKYNDKYIDKIIELEIDEVIHEHKEPFSDHFGHGSAKFKNDKDA